MDKRMKSSLAIVGGLPPPYGGVSVSLQRLIRYLDLSHLDYVVYNTSSSKTEHPRIIDVGWSLLWMIKMLFFSRHQVVQFSTSRWWIRLFAAMLNIATGSKIIIYARGYSLPNSYFKGSSVKRFLVKKTLEHTCAVFAPNPDLAEKICQIGFPKERVSVIPPFIPPRESPDEREIPSRVRDFCKGKFPILAANGGFVKIDNKDVYGLFALTKLAKSLIDKFPNSAIVVYIRSGVDIATEEFKCLLDETNNVPLKDHFLFFTSEGEFYPFLSICDIFLRPTSTDGDSNSVREALRCNIPVVASDVIPRPVGCRIYPFEKEEEFVKLVTQVAENIDAEKKRLTDIPSSNAADLLIEKYYQLLSH